MCLYYRNFFNKHRQITLIKTAKSECKENSVTVCVVAVDFCGSSVCCELVSLVSEVSLVSVPVNALI